MGLDITAYSNLRYIGRHAGDDNYEHHYDPKTGDQIDIEGWAYNDFPHALAGPYRIEQGKHGLTVGRFDLTEKTETHRFCAGSYRGYNEWRRELQAAFNPDTERDLPFYELIWFADNEGTILTGAARDLVTDFETQREQFRDFILDRHATESQWFLDRYEDWAHAFKLAAECGLVDFH